MPKRITRFKDALNHFGEIVKSKVGDTELTLESNIAYVLMDKANKGNLQAIKLLIDVFGWNEAIKNEHKILKSDDIIFKIKDEP